MVAITIPQITDWVKLILAAFLFPRERCIDATTEQPMPSISPMPLTSSHNGQKMFTAARASLPMPRPTKAPSIVVIRDIQTIPINVGINIFRNNIPMSALPKSMLSRFITSQKKISTIHKPRFKKLVARPGIEPGTS